MEENDAHVLYSVCLVEAQMKRYRPAYDYARYNPRDAPVSALGGEQCGNCCCASWDHKEDGSCHCGKCPGFMAVDLSVRGQDSK